MSPSVIDLDNVRHLRNQHHGRNDQSGIIEVLWLFYPSWAKRETHMEFSWNDTQMYQVAPLKYWADLFSNSGLRAGYLIHTKNFRNNIWITLLRLRLSKINIGQYSPWIWLSFSHSDLSRASIVEILVEDIWQAWMLWKLKTEIAPELIGYIPLYSIRIFVTFSWDI